MRSTWSAPGPALIAILALCVLGHCSTSHGQNAQDRPPGPIGGTGIGPGSGGAAGAPVTPAPGGTPDGPPAPGSDLLPGGPAAPGAGGAPSGAPAGPAGGAPPSGVTERRYGEQPAGPASPNGAASGPYGSAADELRGKAAAAADSAAAQATRNRAYGYFGHRGEHYVWNTDGLAHYWLHGKEWIVPLNFVPSGDPNYNHFVEVGGKRLWAFSKRPYHHGYAIWYSPSGESKGPWKFFHCAELRYSRGP